MPKPTRSKKSTSTSTRSAAIPLRRSPRLLGVETNHLNPSNPPLKGKTTEPGKRILVCGTPVSGPGQVSVLSRRKVKPFSGLRRSPRLSVLVAKKESIQVQDEIRSKNTKFSGDDSKSRLKGEAGTGNCCVTVIDLGARKERLGECSGRDRVGDVCAKTEGVRETKLRLKGKAGSVNCCVAADLGARKERLGESSGRDRDGDVCAQTKGVRDNTKRKKEEGGKEGSVREWTREQEMALQRAYLLAKPTPHFWKKVSKLVPGKSAQDCYDKIHSESMTPPQPLRRSRAKSMNLSPLGSFSLSASKVLNISETKIKKLCHNKKKTSLAQKTVRQLLQKHNRTNQGYEADLFTVLEPGINQLSQDVQMNPGLSTPKHLEKKQGFLQICSEKSSSASKKPLSRFSNSKGTDLVSPAVLKPVKNRALHEKYIDQLHNREVKRKRAYARSAKLLVAGKENRLEVETQKLDANAAKTALICGARDAIDQLQHLQAVTREDSLDFEDDTNVDHDETDSEI